MTTPQETKGPQHTPGPWRTGAGQCHTVYGGTLRQHRMIARCGDETGRTNGEEDFANARLIAAAPALLAALQRIARLDPANGDVRQLLDIRDDARAALALVHSRKGD